jgi:ABC-type sugar transport system permease subunit
VAALGADRPQLLIIGIFFWPAGQAVLQSFQMEDAFGMSTEWVGWTTSASCSPTPPI